MLRTGGIHSIVTLITGNNYASLLSSRLQIRVNMCSHAKLRHESELRFSDFSDKGRCREDGPTVCIPVPVLWALLSILSATACINCALIAVTGLLSLLSVPTRSPCSCDPFANYAFSLFLFLAFLLLLSFMHLRPRSSTLTLLYDLYKHSIFATLSKRRNCLQLRAVINLFPSEVQIVIYYPLLRHEIIPNPQFVGFTPWSNIDILSYRVSSRIIACRCLSTHQSWGYKRCFHTSLPPS